MNGVIFLDVKKAFDTIDHHADSIVKTASLWDTRPHAQTVPIVFGSKKENLHVNLNNCKSDIGTIRCGVPQGSNLGPLLFLNYINDLPNCLETTHSNLFADDTILSCQGHLSIYIEYKLNKDLVNAQKWLSAKKLTLNNEKTKYMIIGSWQTIEKT